MFNEILMGKETLEPPPVPVSPYRVQSIPAAATITATCIECERAFEARVNSGAVRCSICNLQLVEKNQVESARIYAQAEAQYEESQRSMRRWRWAGFAVLSVCLGLIRGQMEEQIDEDEAAQAAVYRPYVSSYSDEYSSDLSWLANEACACKDLKCARDVQARVTQFLRRTTGPSNDTAEEQGSKSLARIGECVTQFE